ncbi:MAG TPA: ATP-dependent metallopeptidase FtsH/Yme1/Tma family protein, partial [Gaiellaceae bacterium]|nr:ATP-dependent metallopeptidase FtsH/Yme1/Tma family protein [Gaiellaceae bacterium]
MNRFFRSALFPLIIIAALVWLALQTLGSHTTKVEKQTTSQLYSLVSNNPGQIDVVTITPSKQQLDITLTDGKKISVHYATPQSEAALEQSMLANKVQFNSKGVGSSPWWSIL